jgi:hypothetical protein
MWRGLSNFLGRFNGRMTTMTEQQTDLPLFSKRGQWVGYADDVIATLDPARQAIYASLRDEVMQLDQIEGALKSAQGHVVATADEIREVEAMKPKPMTHHDLWLQHCGRRPRHANPGA